MPALDTTASSPTANAYCDVATAVDYFTNYRADGSVFLALSSSEQAVSLIWGASVMDACFDYPGRITYLPQAMRWPRVGVLDADGRYVDQNSIPSVIVQCNAIQALELSRYDRTLPPKLIAAGFSDVTIGPIRLHVDATKVLPLIPDIVIAMMNVFGQVKPTGVSPDTVKMMTLRRT